MAEENGADTQTEETETETGGIEESVPRLDPSQIAAALKEARDSGHTLAEEWYDVYCKADTRRTKKAAGRLEENAAVVSFLESLKGLVDRDAELANSLRYGGVAPEQALTMIGDLRLLAQRVKDSPHTKRLTELAKSLGLILENY